MMNRPRISTLASAAALALAAGLAGCDCSGDVVAASCGGVCPAAQCIDGTCVSEGTDASIDGATHDGSIVTDDSAIDAAIDAPDVVTDTGVDSGLPAYCSGSGPLIVGPACSDDLAGRTFRFAICTCEGISTSSTLQTDAYDSSLGPYEPGHSGGAVGVNASLALAAVADIGGSLLVSGASGIQASANVNVGVDLQCGGPYNAENDLAVYRDAEVDGRVHLHALSVGGSLTLPAGAPLETTSSTVGSTLRADVTVDEPCACGSADLIDVAGIVAARATDNDNDAADFDPAALRDRTTTTFELPCGRLYVDGLSARGDTTFVVNQRTALFIRGDLSLEGSLTIELGPEGELDLFVGGNVLVPGTLTVGDPSRAAHARVYVGGTGTVELSRVTTFAANLYAPSSELVVPTGVELYGSVFMRRIAAGGPVSVHFDSAIRDTSDCDDPVVPPGVDAGIDTPGCDSCLDCGTQACIEGECAPCRNDGDCCAPLVCESGVCTEILY